MNWNKDKSLQLSKVCVILFAVALITACFTAPWLLQRFIISWGNLPKEMLIKFLVTTYLTAIPVAAALYQLHRFLDRIGKGQIFEHKNVNCLRYLSWCCFCAALILGVSGIYCIPLAALAVLAAFVGLVLRVVKNVFEQAVWLKEENDYTV